MPSTRLKVHDPTQDGKAFLDGGSGWKWTHSGIGGNEGFTVGQWIILRFPCDLPRGATVSAATFKGEYLQKAPATVPQTTNFTWHIEPAAPAYPTTENSYFTAGTAGLTTYRTTLTGGNYVINYTANTTATDFITISLTSMLQTLVNRSDYKPGAYFSVMFYCTAEGTNSDLSLNLDNTYIDATYTVPATEKRRADVNVLWNQTFTTNADGADTSDFFGEFVTGTTVERVATSYSSGSLRVNSGPASGNKGFTGSFGRHTLAGESWTFSGWVYVPSAITALVECGFWFEGGYVTITARNTWVEFCSMPVTPGSDTILRPHIRVAGPTATGRVVYLDDVCLMRTQIRQPPFIGDTPDKFNKDNQYTQTQARGQSVRESRARSYFHDGSSMKPREGYVRRSDGLWVRADKQKM